MKQKQKTGGRRGAPTTHDTNTQSLPLTQPSAEAIHDARRNEHLVRRRGHRARRDQRGGSQRGGSLAKLGLCAFAPPVLALAKNVMQL